MGWGGRDKQQNNDKQGRRRLGGGDSDGGSDNQGQQMKEQIQAIIRDELKTIIDGEGDTGERLTRVHGNQRFHVRKPIKVGDRRERGGGRGGSSRDPVIRHDIELLTQVQMELSEELAENLKQLKTVIAESQALAERIQAVLGQSKTKS